MLCSGLVGGWGEIWEYRTVKTKLDLQSLWKIASLIIIDWPADWTGEQAAPAGGAHHVARVALVDLLKSEFVLKSIKFSHHRLTSPVTLSLHTGHSRLSSILLTSSEHLVRSWGSSSASTGVWQSLDTWDKRDRIKFSTFCLLIGSSDLNIVLTKTWLLFNPISSHLASSKMVSGKMDTYSTPGSWYMFSSETLPVVSMCSSKSLVTIMLGRLQLSSSKMGEVIWIEGITCMLQMYDCRVYAMRCKFCLIHNLRNLFKSLVSILKWK